MPPKKRSALTLEQRVEVIRKSEKEHLSNRKIAEQLGVGRTQIDNVLKLLYYELCLLNLERNMMSAGKIRYLNTKKTPKQI